jgi:hypothetical protein
MRFPAAHLGLLLVALPLRAASVIEQVTPPDAHPGDEILVSITVLDASVGQFDLPPVDGLQPAHDPSLMTSYSFNNGVFSRRVVETFHLVANRAGDYTIPAFDVPLAGGGTVPAPAIAVHVSAGDATNPPAPVQTPAAPPSGPAVLPPGGNPSSQNGDAGNDAQEPALHAPLDPDGEPAKVFLLATPETTQAYVKQAIKLRIDFFIRIDALAPQDSLPVVKGSDFLVTNVSERPSSGMVFIDGRQYQVDRWSTAVLPLKAGDLELTTERDTYWNKNTGGGGLDAALGSFLGRNNDLGHQNIPSNSQLIHVAPLPDEGKPNPPSDAVGQFAVTGDAQPTSVAVGEPVTLYFVINGSGNFNYVRSPAVAADGNWKVYPPQSGMTFRDEAHTEGYKRFEQSLIPLKAGTLHLPAVSFSYFDPVTKQYSSPPIDLPVINVAPGQAPAPPPAEGSVAGASGAAAAASFSPNRIFAGAVRPSLAPVYRQPWFWSLQAGAVLLPAVALIVLAAQHRRRHAAALMAARDEQKLAMGRDHEAMNNAARRGDAVAFFTAARHLLQLHLSGRWALPPEAITPRTIEARDAALAEILAPFFAEADDTIYSGRVAGPVDFARWQALVLHPPEAQLA